MSGQHRWFFLSLVFTFVIPEVEARDNTLLQRHEEIIYAHKHGVAFTFDLFQPKQPNGGGVLFIASGGWVSTREGFFEKFTQPATYKPFLERGYTVFVVFHGSQPKFEVPEILDDLRRAVRFIRHHAAEYKIDANRLGVTGMSAGGHLSLMLGTTAAKGDPKAKDPVDRESTAIRSVACFCPPTDFLNYGRSGVNALDAQLRGFRPAFGLAHDTPSAKWQKLAVEISPANHVSPATVPTLILHGDADTLVPFQQAEIFVGKCAQAKVPARLVRKPGAAHAWPKMETDFAICADWFDQHLRKAER